VDFAVAARFALPGVAQSCETGRAAGSGQASLLKFQAWRLALARGTVTKAACHLASVVRRAAGDEKGGKWQRQAFGRRFAMRDEPIAAYGREDLDAPTDGQAC